MTDLQRTARVAEIQSYLRTQPKLKLEFLATVSRLFREYKIDLPHDVLAGMTLTLERSNGRKSTNNSRTVNTITATTGPPPNPFHAGDDIGPPPNPFHDDDDIGPPPNPFHAGDDIGPPPNPFHDNDDIGPPPNPFHDDDDIGPPPNPFQG